MFHYFDVTAIQSNDTLKTVHESLAAIDNIVPAHGYPFPVDGCSEGSLVWVMNIVHPGLNMQPEGIPSGLVSGENGGHMCFDQKGKFCSSRNCSTSLDVCAGVLSC